MSISSLLSGHTMPQRLFLILLVAGLVFGIGNLALPAQRQSTRGNASGPLKATFLRETAAGRALAVYLSCIDSCDPALRTVLGFGPEAIPPLIQLTMSGLEEGALSIQGDVPLIVRTRAIRALGPIRDARALRALTVAAEDSKVGIRAAVASALGHADSQEAFTVLLQLLRDRDQVVREISAHSLHKLGRPEALPALREAAAFETKPHVRHAMEAAIEALQKR